MLPPGPLGTRADILMDIVVMSFVLILPTIVWSWARARATAYTAHKRIQVVLFSTLTVVVILFEADMRMSGGIFEMTSGSRFAGTALLNGSIWFHTALSISTSVLWIWLVIVSLRRFPKPAAPAEFSAKHRLWGRIAMVAMALTGITGIELYVLGFMF